MLYVGCWSSHQNKSRYLYDFLDPIFKVEPALFVIVAEVAHGRKSVLCEVVGVGGRVVEVTLDTDHLLIIIIIILTSPSCRSWS